MKENEVGLFIWKMIYGFNLNWIMFVFKYEKILWSWLIKLDMFRIKLLYIVIDYIKWCYVNLLNLLFIYLINIKEIFKKLVYFGLFLGIWISG